MTCVSLSQPPQMSCIVAIGIILGDWHDTGAGTSEKVAAENIVLQRKELDGGFPRSNDNNSTKKVNFSLRSKIKNQTSKWQLHLQVKRIYLWNHHYFHCSSSPREPQYALVASVFFSPNVPDWPRCDMSHCLVTHF